MLILYAIVAACFLGGAALVWHSIGSSAVAKHEQAVKVEQDKVAAVAKVKMEATADALIDMQAAYEKGQSEREVVQKTVYVKGQAYAVATPVFQNKDCVVPKEGMDQLNKARGQEAARILGLGDAPISITEPKTIEPKRVPFPDLLPRPAEHPKPVPLK